MNIKYSLQFLVYFQVYKRGNSYLNSLEIGVIQQEPYEPMDGEV